ncbi:MAG: glycosyltransferase [Candidatus Omnitrophota bacterium]
MEKVINHYNSIALKRDEYIKKNSYYYQLLFGYYRYLIPEKKRILEIGSGTGELLNALNPSYGVGIDVSGEMVHIAQSKFTHLKFYSGQVHEVDLSETFDYIILSGVLGESDDIQSLLQHLHKFATKDTRIIIEYYSYLWQILLKGAERLRLKMPQMIQNWLTHNDLKNFLNLTGYESIRIERKILLPKYIPFLSAFINKIIANLPFLNALTLNHFMIARPLVMNSDHYSVTILIPAKNEKGNIEEAVLRTPVFGSRQEFIFVEGNSSDGTYEEIELVMKALADKDIKLYKQTGKGKGDAVRLGFSQASGDILMILDADLTTPPEDLPKFYEALRDGKGEFINGNRLVYPMEKEAMRFLNLIANKFFGLFFSWLLGQTYKDTLCGTKVLFRHHYRQIVENRAYFGDFDPFGDFDLIFGAAKQNLKTIEVPVRYKERTYGSTQIRRFYHGLLLFRMCWFSMKKIKFR